MYQTILVPLDGSKLAECVLPHVEMLVRGSQAKRVVFTRVVEPVYLSARRLHYAGRSGPEDGGGNERGRSELPQRDCQPDQI